jgi:hypothetical protein
MVLSLPRCSERVADASLPGMPWGDSVSCRMTKSDPVSVLSFVFYYEFSRQRAGLLIYLSSSEITNAEHMPSGHLIEPTAA